jgi:hypothetical protein
VLIIKARWDKAQEFDGSRNAVAKSRVSEYVHGKSMLHCTDNKERSPMDEQLHTFLKSFLCRALVLSYFLQVV